MNEDTELAGRCVVGDAAALEELIIKYRKQLGQEEKKVKMKMKKSVLALAAAAIISTGAVGCVAVVRPAPPAPRYEVVGVAPFPGAVWIGGHWVRRFGEWRWLRGHWAARPWRGAVWHRGHWRQTRYGWKWVGGHWGHR